MGFLDNAKNLIDQHDEQVDQALEQGGDLAKGRFAGHDAQIDGAVDRAQEMTGAGDTVPDVPGDPPPPAP
jgi:MT0933-like antitoxin protein